MYCTDVCILYREDTGTRHWEVKEGYTHDIVEDTGAQAWLMGAGASMLLLLSELLVELLRIFWSLRLGLMMSKSTTRATTSSKPSRMKPPTTPPTMAPICLSSRPPLDASSA